MLVQIRSLTVGLTVSILAALVTWLVANHQRLKSNFDGVAIGETQIEVLRTLGDPHMVTECGRFGGTPSAGCDDGPVTAVAA